MVRVEGEFVGEEHQQRRGALEAEFVVKNTNKGGGRWFCVFWEFVDICRESVTIFYYG